MHATLFILAAGMGSRYGGLKQLDGLGPNGETIMDYSVYDAIRSGFDKVVFVIREYFAEDFEIKIVSKYRGFINTEVVSQELNKIPDGYTYNSEREKPWGTNHAVLMGSGVIHEPFAVINADDFYGYESFRVLASFLKEINGKENEYCMVGYHLGNTLSESGSVSRGVCSVDKDGYLQNIVERTHIQKEDDTIYYLGENSERITVEPQTIVSMNMWGFTPDYYKYSMEYFKEFLRDQSNNLKSEFFIPKVVNSLIEEAKVRCKVIDTSSTWFGVTYAEDRPNVIIEINKLIQQGIYPHKLF